MLVAPMGGLLAQLTGYGHFAGHVIGTPSGLMALAAAALTCVLAGFLARAARTARDGHGDPAAQPCHRAARAVPPHRLPAAA